MESMKARALPVRIYYDGQCPFCTEYVRLLRLREAAGPVELVNLREDAAARARFTARGLDADEGMIVEADGRTFHGAEAMNALSLMSSQSGVLNRISAAIFRHRLAARLLYPVLRAGRNATLLFMDRDAMRTPAPGEAALFEIFARFVGLFSVLHVFIYVFKYTPLAAEITTLPLLLMGLLLIFAPGSRRLFVAAVIVLAIDGWLRAPIYSNHTMLKNFLMLAIVAGGAWHWLRGSSWERFFQDVRPVGRMLLLIMYAFGIFHKINTDFLNPATSCAVALWRDMPPPLAWIDNPAMHYLAIYGTFAAEGLIMLCLLVPRWRHWGIGGGIAFHGLLALSGYAMYAVFSTLSIVLHVLFLSPGAALRISQSPLYARLHARINSVPGVLYIMAVLLFIVAAAIAREYSLIAMLWLLLMVWPLAVIVIGHGRPQVAGEEAGPFLWSRLAGLNVVTALFLLNCLAPYFGLKTAQTMNMFANIRLEGGVSNHLVLRGAPGPFGYLDDLVVVRTAQGAPYLEQLAARRNQALIYYHFLSVLADTPDARVSYDLNGTHHDAATARDILARDGDMLHPPVVRKIFHFRPVLLARPTPCD